MSNAMRYIRELEGDMNIKNELVKINERMNQRFAEVDKRFVEVEFRITTRLGFLMVSTTTIAVAFLAG